MVKKSKSSLLSQLGPVSRTHVVTHVLHGKAYAVWEVVESFFNILYSIPRDSFVTDKARVVMSYFTSCGSLTTHFTLHEDSSATFFPSS